MQTRLLGKQTNKQRKNNKSPQYFRVDFHGFQLLQEYYFHYNFSQQFLLPNPSGPFSNSVELLWWVYILLPNNTYIQAAISNNWWSVCKLNPHFLKIRHCYDNVQLPHHSSSKVSCRKNTIHLSAHYFPLYFAIKTFSCLTYFEYLWIQFSCCFNFQTSNAS